LFNGIMPPASKFVTNPLEVSGLLAKLNKAGIDRVENGFHIHMA
jgi:aconitase A